MYKILFAHFAHLRKNRFFLICMSFMFLFGPFLIISNYIASKKTGYMMPLDDYLFLFSVLIGILFAAFSSLFLGTEYSDGTIRNKLVVGHTRRSIYLSALIANCGAVIFLELAYITGVIIVGIPLLGFLNLPPASIFTLLGCVCMMSFALSALFTFVSMLVHSKSLACVISIIGAVIMLFYAAYINMRLQEPEVYDSYIYQDDAGNIVNIEPEVNPNYLEGTKRDVYEFIYDYLPAGQALQISQMTVTNAWRLSLYSLNIIIIFTACGLVVFHRKDIS